MRMLHTSDWHVGKPLRGRSRLDEQEAVKQQILEIIRDEKVGCVLVSGDLFDSQAPFPMPRDWFTTSSPSFSPETYPPS